jgi:signal transduction histidine kinase
MVLEYISNYLDPSLYHRFFYFLSTDAGILFERSVEVVIYLILLYMVVSEFLRSRTDELRYFILAFASLLFLRLVSVVVMGNVVFGILDSNVLNTMLPVVVHFIEVLTLIFLINAFLYQIFSKKVKRLGKAIAFEIGMIVLISAFVEILWLLVQSGSPGLKFQSQLPNMMFISIELVLILSALIIIFQSKKETLKYKEKLLIAFSIYAFAPIIEMINVIFYGYGNPKLQIVEFPIPLLAMMFFTEVTYLKLVDKAYLKEKLKESEKKYESEKELGKMKDEFVSVVSHELRTPITSMKLYCGLMHKGKFGKISTKQHQAIHILESELDRLNNLINDILNLSKMESGKDKVELEEFDLNELKEQIVNNSASEKGIKLVFEIPKGFKARVDKRKFIQLYTNLFGNAVKFTEKEGRVDVKVEDLGQKWTISVADTGRGIPEDEIPKLFDKFYQVESHMTRSVGGTGLGLAIVKSIVDLHKGVIEVKSQPGKGSEFKIYFKKA